VSNGNKNGASLPNITDLAVLQDLVQGLSAPGYIRLPVCSLDEASKNSLSSRRYDTYPCNDVAGTSDAATTSLSRQFWGCWAMAAALASSYWVLIL
jgi:hypothetical protein